MLKSDIKKDIQKLAAGILGKEPNEIDPDAHLINDLGMPPLMIIDIMVEIEMKYKILLSDNFLHKFTTINKAIEFITRSLNKKL